MGVRRWSLVVLVPLLFACAAPEFVFAPRVPRITAQELRARLGEPGIAIVDAREESQWEATDRIIPGAIRGAAGDVGSWAGRLPKDQTVIVYCA